MKADMSPPYTQQFFELQLTFAQKIANISQQPFDQVLLHFTAFYRILGLSWSLDPMDAIWQKYLQELQLTSAKADATYQIYLSRYPDLPKFTDQEHWGCFAYDYHPEKQVIHPHFSNQDINGVLSHHRIAVRISELRAMFQQIKQRHSEALLVQGASWLYCREAYKRLFPPAFGQSARPEKTFALTGRNIWNQFLRQDGSVHQETMSLFLERVSQLQQVEDYPQCFPYPNIRTEASIELFYTFYGVD